MMDIYTLFSALAIILLPGLGCYVYSKNTLDPLYIVFAIFAVLAGYLAFCELQIHLAATPEVAAFWSKLRFIRFFLIPLLAHVLILYTGLKSPRLNPILVYLGLYLPAVLFTIFDFFTDEHLRQLALTPQGYAILQLPPFTPFYMLYEIWVLSLGLTACGLTFIQFRKNPAFRASFVYILLATAVPICGRLLEILFFLTWPYRLPTFYPLFASWLIFFLYLGVRRQKFQRLTPYEIINTVIDTMAEAYLLLDTKGRILNVNKACLELLGYSREELEGHSFAVFKLNKKELSYIDTRISRGKGIKNREMWIKTKKSREIYVNFSCSFIYSQNNFSQNNFTPPGTANILGGSYSLSGFVCVFSDLTAKKVIEKDLQQQRDWLKIILESIDDGIMATDRSGKINFMNKAAERITEWSMDEAYGNDIDLIFKVVDKVGDKVADKLTNKVPNSASDKETREGGINLIEQMLAQGILNSSTHNILLITKNGKEIPIDHKFAPLQDEQQNLWGAILIFRDMSEIVGSKQELKATQDQLIHSEKLAGLGRLAAGVAHEINNPLGYITSNLRTLTKYVAALKEAYKQYQQLLVKIGPLPSEIEREFDKKLVLDFIIEDIDEIVKENKEGIDKIVQIVSDLKSFTHSSPEEVFKPADINKAIKNTITVTRNEFKYVADVKCELAELPEVQCNLGEINQVLLNVIVNAAQAIKSQKRVGKGLIQITTLNEEDLIRCEITDDGPGILPENLNRIFEPFFTTKPPGEGTGLGLSISYDIIVNKHRGAFLVDSTPGQGSKFIITLPKKQS